MGGIGSGAKPREYPKSVVALACSMYESGMTVAEIRPVFPKGYRVQTILQRYLPERRAAGPREQRGNRNASWKGDAAGYAALHLRVASARGKPMACEWCPSAGDSRYEWANLTGDYQDVADYARLCISCHRRFDAARRRITGQRTTPKERW